MSDTALQLLQGESGAPTPSGRSADVDSERMATHRIPEELSILPVRGFVMFPGTVTPLTVSRAN
jgi:hypothetical protein